MADVRGKNKLTGDLNGVVSHLQDRHINHYIIPA